MPSPTQTRSAVPGKKRKTGGKQASFKPQRPGAPNRQRNSGERINAVPPGAPGDNRKPKGKKYLFLSGSQAGRDLKVHDKVGGVKGGAGVADYYKSTGDTAAAEGATKRLTAIRTQRAAAAAAKKSGDTKAYKKARTAYKTSVIENRTARLNINQKTLGLGGAYKDGLTVGSKKGIGAKIKSGKINRKTQRGRIR